MNKTYPTFYKKPPPEIIAHLPASDPGSAYAFLSVSSVTSIRALLKSTPPQFR